ncbi:MAG: hypothetical protein HY717_12835 [Planctomycetes bacterium]|nr:hypothetical protein [Planctomycetota bacterium]
MERRGKLAGPFCLVASGIFILSVFIAPLRAERFLFIVDDTYFLVWRVDPKSGEARRAISLPTEAMANGVPPGTSGLAYDGSSLYYTHSAAGHIWVLDPFSGAVQRRLPKPQLAISGLGAGGGKLYAAPTSPQSGSWFALDPASGGVQAVYRLPGIHEALSEATGRGTLFAKAGALELEEIDLQSGAAVASWPLPDEVLGLAYDSALDLLFAVTNDAWIHRLDPATGEERGRFQVQDAAGNEILRISALAAGELVEGDSRLGAPSPPAETVFDIQDVDFQVGHSQEVPVLLTSPFSLEGFSIAWVHDPRMLVLEKVGLELKSAPAADLAADFLGSRIFSNGGALEVLFDAIAPFEDSSLAPGIHQPVAWLEYRGVQMDLEQPAATEVRLLDGGLGGSTAENLIIHQGMPYSPLLLPGKWTLLPVAAPPGDPQFICGGPLGAGHLPAAIQSPRGGVFELSFYYSFPEPQSERIQGLSMALAYDCRLGCRESSFQVPEDSITALVKADFVEFQCDDDPDDGDGCEMILGILVDSLPPFGGSVLPAAPFPLLLAKVEMEVGLEAEIGKCLPIQFRDNLNGRGSVYIRNLMAVANFPVLPRTASCQVCIEAVEPAFYCGAGVLGADGRPEAVTGRPGEEVELYFWYSSPGEEVYSLTQALRIDCRLECLEGTFQVDPEVAPFVNVSFIDFQCDPDPGDGDGCELILHLPRGAGRRPLGSILPPTVTPRRIGKAKLRISPQARRGACLAAEFRDSLNGAGTRLFSNQVDQGQGATVPVTFDGRVCVQPGERPKFFCGGPALGEDQKPIGQSEVPRGERTPFCFWYSSPPNDLTGEDELQGLSMALSYDCNLKCIEGSFRIPPDSITALLGAEFVEFQNDNDPRDGDGCEMILAILIDSQPPFDHRTLPPTDIPLKLACVDMELSPLAKLGFCVDVKFVDGVNGKGTVPIKNLVSAESLPIRPETFDCKVCVKHLGPKFYCGGGALEAGGLPEIPRAKPGKPAELCLWYSSPEDGSRTDEQLDHLQGLTMALSFNCRLDCKEASFRMPPDSITAAMEAEFVSFQCDDNPADGDGCEMILGILIDAQPPFDGRTLPPSDIPLKVACLDVTLPDNAACGECFSVRFQDGVNGRGNVPTFNLVATENLSFLALTSDCKVCARPATEPVFIRGDCNADLGVNIADAADVISFVYGRGSWQSRPPCLDACDANDDARVDLADAHAILRYLFKLGSPPPAPGPHLLGPDPTGDKLGCGIEACP